MRRQVTGPVPLHADHAPSTDPEFAVLLAVAGIASAVLVGLALAALVRRRSRSYLLVTLALATLLARSAVGALLFTGSVSAASHHWAEHVLDVAMAALVVAAVYDARTVRRTGDADPSVRGDGGARPERPDVDRRDDPRDGDRSDGGPGGEGP